MFRTIGHTIELMKMSWRVLMLDRELLLFPLMAGASLLVLLAAAAAAGGAAGTFGRLAADGGGSSVTGADAAIGLAFAFGASAIVIFFNSALVAAALERLRGGDPDVRSGLRAAAARLPQILAWALISVIVTAILQALRERGGLAGAVAAMIGGVAWGLATFFVIPVLVAEGVGPIEAIRRSASLLRETWGRQVASNFGFGVLGLAAVLAAVAVGALLFAAHPVLGVAAGVTVAALGLGAVQALEGVFKAALYDYARGHDPHGFDRATLGGAYRAL